jgi:hypothetical protein
MSATVDPTARPAIQIEGDLLAAGRSARDRSVPARRAGSGRPGITISIWGSAGRGAAGRSGARAGLAALAKSGERPRRRKASARTSRPNARPSLGSRLGARRPTKSTAATRSGQGAIIIANGEMKLTITSGPLTAPLRSSSQALPGTFLRSPRASPDWSTPTRLL